MCSSSSRGQKGCRGARPLLLILVAFPLCLLTGSCAGEPPLLVVDTVSGANFQWFFKRQAIPLAEEVLGCRIDYIVSSGPEMVERMKAWGGASPGVDLLLLKPMDLAAVFDADLPLAPLAPDAIRRASHIEGLEGERVLGRELAHRAVPLWRSQTGLIYDTRFVAAPPRSWRELGERADQWHERIGVIRPDAKSSGGRGFVYGFLAACGVDMALPLDSLERSPRWRQAWERLADFSRHVKMPMGEAPFLFQQFKKEEVWLAVYSMDYALWARDQGFLPPELGVVFLEEGMPAGSDAYAAVPDGLPPERLAQALSFIDFLLSERIQMLLAREMSQYPSVSLRGGAVTPPGCPPWETVKTSRIEFLGREAMDFIRENATGFMITAKKRGEG